ncbi:MAG: hypothetical protein JWR10_4416 [Rubritepida sp.]|nr:hypothetical protein [Rubritepida sp.]
MLRGLKPLPMARRRGLTAAPVPPTRTPEAFAFYEAPVEPDSAPREVEELAWQSETVSRIGPVE